MPHGLDVGAVVRKVVSVPEHSALFDVGGRFNVRIIIVFRVVDPSRADCV